jgi:hypothetical protein
MNPFNLPSDKDMTIKGIEALTSYGSTLKNNPKISNIFMQSQIPSAQNKQPFENWYANLRQNNPSFPASPYNHPNYNMYGFWQGSQIPNSGASTAINPNDNRLHFSDNYVNQKGDYVQLKAPWHDNKWTTFAWPLYEQGKLNQQDIQGINDWNAKRLGKPRNEGGM